MAAIFNDKILTATVLSSSVMGHPGPPSNIKQELVKLKKKKSFLFSHPFCFPKVYFTDKRHLLDNRSSECFDHRASESYAHLPDLLMPSFLHFFSHCNPFHFHIAIFISREREGLDPYLYSATTNKEK